MFTRHWSDPWKDMTWWRCFSTARASRTRRSVSLWVSPSTDRRSLWASCRRPPGTSASAVAVLEGHACVQRCQYHKRQNVVSYLPKGEQVRIRRKMEAAYGKPTYAAAKAALDALKPGLKLMNQSALGSLEEGFEETLTLHRLGLMPMLEDAFRTTNCIENVNSLPAQLTHNVRRWTNSSQRHRWVATALLDIEQLAMTG